MKGGKTERKSKGKDKEDRKEGIKFLSNRACKKPSKRTKYKHREKYNILGITL